MRVRCVREVRTKCVRVVSGAFRKGGSYAHAPAGQTRRQCRRGAVRRCPGRAASGRTTPPLPERCPGPTPEPAAAGRRCGCWTRMCVEVSGWVDWRGGAVGGGHGGAGIMARSGTTRRTHTRSHTMGSRHVGDQYTQSLCTAITRRAQYAYELQKMHRTTTAEGQGPLTPLKKNPFLPQLPRPRTE